MRNLRLATIGLAFLAMIGGLATVTAATAATAADTQPPTAPTNLRVTDVTPNTVSLAWNPSTDNSGDVHYVIRQTGGSYPSVVDWVRGTNFTFTSLDAGTPFTFTVTAKDASGNFSAPSNTVSVTTEPADTEAPTTPTGLRVTGTTATSVSLAWDPSTDNVGVLGYWVTLDGWLTHGTGETSYTFTGLEPGTTYRFVVTALDAAHPTANQSAPSNEVTATTGS